MSERQPETAQRSTHVVYRIGSEFSYQETPCFCPARQSHSVLDTVVIPPAQRVHNHPPYRPVCNERQVDGRLRGACLNDDGSDR